MSENNQLLSRRKLLTSLGAATAAIGLGISRTHGYGSSVTEHVYSNEAWGLMPGHQDEGLKRLGPFTTGIRIKSRNELLECIENNVITGYRWNGALPHLTMADHPRDDGGIYEGAWVAVFEVHAADALRDELGTAAGAAMIGYRAQHVYEKLDEFVSVTDYGAVGDGVHDDSAAFAAAFAASKYVFVPNCPSYYVVGDVDIPLGLTIYGCARKPYTVSTISDVTGIGGAIVKRNGANNLFRWSSRITMRGIVLYGVDMVSDAMASIGGRISGCRMEDCGVYKFRYGTGNPSHVGTSVFLNCHFSGNVKGICALVDSKVIGGFTNANVQQGVDMQTGANDNTFIGLKNEWNGAENYRFYQSVHNSIVGGVCDRSGLAGVRVANSTVTVTGGFYRRNGKTNLGSSECAHFHIEGATTTIIITGIATGVGANDDKTGDTTPSYSVSFGGSAVGGAVVTGNSLIGAVTSPVRYGVVPSALTLSSNVGAEDRVNVGYNQTQKGQMYIARVAASNLAPGARSAVSVSQPPIAANSLTRRKALVTMHHASAGTSEYAELNFMQLRGGGGCRIDFMGVHFESAPNIAGMTGTNTTQLTFSNIALDGATFDLSIQNNGTETRTVSVDWV